jgi:hypothetical protein
MAGAQDDNRQQYEIMFDLFFCDFFTITDLLFVIYSFKKQQNRQDYNANAKRKNSFGKRENLIFLSQILFDIQFFIFQKKSNSGKQ